MQPGELPTRLRWLDGELADQAVRGRRGYTMADICALSTVDFADWIGLPIRTSRRT